MVPSDTLIERYEAVEVRCTWIEALIDGVVGSDRFVEIIVKGMRALTDTRIKRSKNVVTGRS